jgi:ABC-type transport system substrate-binding protein
MDDNGGEPLAPGPAEPPDAAEAERWKSVKPLRNWRKETRPGLLGRYPVLGVAIVLVLAAGAALAVLGALRSGARTSAAGSVGGVLQVAVVGLPSLDPADARDPKAVMVVDQLYDTLVRNAGGLQPVPGLARSFEANPQQTVFTFHLAPGIRFDDGSPVSSADVKFTLERIARKGSDSPLATHLETVTGYAAFHTAGTAAGLAGIETPDPATVVVRLDQPFSTFPSVLAHPGFGIVPKAAVERLGAAFKQKPVGSGPFRRVDSGTPGRLSLRRVASHVPEARV